MRLGEVLRSGGVLVLVVRNTVVVSVVVLVVVVVVKVWAHLVRHLDVKVAVRRKVGGAFWAPLALSTFSSLLLRRSIFTACKRLCRHTMKRWLEWCMLGASRVVESV